MKLSEAIRLGSMLHPQVFNAMWEYDVSDDFDPGFMFRKVIGTCALGAAVMAGYMTALFTTQRLGLPCPYCHYENERWSLDTMITHLNDNHRWTREKIADWVETVEVKQEQRDEVAVCV